LGPRCRFCAGQGAAALFGLRGPVKVRARIVARDPPPVRVLDHLSRAGRSRSHREEEEARGE
jgi:hypothetical protein